MTKIAIIGTAGRDKTKPMTRALWDWMVADAMARIPKGTHLVSGGAAWADHLAVYLFLVGHSGGLTLHLPAPFKDAQFYGPRSSSASAANYYHELFSRSINAPTLGQLEQVTNMETVLGGHEPAAAGYGGMFARNLKVARDADEMLAYTFGPGPQPADGGTKDTWDRFLSTRTRAIATHVTLPILH